MTYMIIGASGFMGREVRRLLTQKQPDAAQILVDVSAGEEGVLPEPAMSPVRPDCIIDFSHHSATKTVTDYAVSAGVPLLEATTGQTPEELEMLHSAAKSVPVFFAANMSVGIAVLIRIAKQAAASFPDADIEIVEIHHNRKLDVPSGTALAIGRALCEVRPGAELVIGRHENGKRAKDQIDIHSLRMGNIAGVHEIHICTASQSLTLRHEAYNRALFAEGALEAASFLVGRPAGMYNMEDYLKG